MGGQYAAAVGYASAQRITKVAIIAGALPLTEPGVFEQLPTMDRMYARLLQRATPLARACFGAMSLAAQCAPHLYGALAARELGPADAAVLRDAGYDAPNGLVHPFEVGSLIGFVRRVDGHPEAVSGVHPPGVPAVVRQARRCHRGVRASRPNQPESITVRGLRGKLPGHA
jgi:hypothetical protein